LKGGFHDKVDKLFRKSSTISFDSGLLKVNDKTVVYRVSLFFNSRKIALIQYFHTFSISFLESLSLLFNNKS
jgi:hypothetical protein